MSSRWQGCGLGWLVPQGGAQGGSDGGSPPLAAGAPGCLAAHQGDGTPWSQEATGIGPGSELTSF